MGIHEPSCTQPDPRFPMFCAAYPYMFLLPAKPAAKLNATFNVYVFPDISPLDPAPFTVHRPFCTDPDVPRSWSSPRCPRCQYLIEQTGRVRNLSFPDAVLGSDRQWVFLFCGSCGTTFDVEPGTR